MQLEKTEILQAFAARLRSTMKRRDVTLSEIADAVGVGTSTVGQWTQGKNFPDVSVQLRLAEFLKEPVGWLIHGEIPPKTESTGNAETLGYLPKGNRLPSTPPSGGVTPRDSSLKVNPGYRLPADQPSPDLCLKYFTEYLSAAAHVPGMVGHTWIQLQKHFPMDEVQRMKSEVNSDLA